MMPGKLGVETPDIIKLPKKTIRERPCDPAIRSTYSNSDISPHVVDFLSRRLAAYVDPASLFSPRLSDIPDPISIPSTREAVVRIERAIIEGQRIALVCDHDMDGTGSAAVLWTALVDFFGVPPDRVTVITSHRLNEGYGITDAVADRILDSGAHLVISADNGSSDETRIAKLAANGIDVIVTDHHVIPVEGPPPSAFAVVNPSRSDAVYDRHVCGAGVAFLLMAKVRSALIRGGHRTGIPSLVALLDYVAVATIADCVSLSPNASLINRAFIRTGLQQIRSLRRPCWRTFMQDQPGDIDPETIGFRLAPAIAAAGRLDWAEMGFRFLISKNDDEADSCWKALKQENAERQTIERRIREQAFKRAVADESPAIVLFLEDGHAGVHGISASRVVEAFGKPCAIFCPKGQGARFPGSPDGKAIAVGSFRSVRTVNIHDALKQVAASNPGLLLSYGGHQAAAGATINTCDFERFRDALCNAITESEGPSGEPEIWTDGELDDRLHTVDAVKDLARLGPFGRGFDPPTYRGTFRILESRELSEGRHGRFRLQRGSLILQAVWFGLETVLNHLPQPGTTVSIAYRLTLNQFRERESVEAFIVAGDVIEDQTL
jgi:single-stranded-DNA-specific exonuclease